MKKILALVVVALVVPSVALAAKPNPPGHSQDPHGKSQAPHGQSQDPHGKATPRVMYVLKGILTGYTQTSTSLTAPVAYTCANGAVTIDIKHANHHGAGLEALTPLTLCLSTTTRVVVKGGGAVTVGDRGIVKVRYAKKFDPTDTAQLTTFLLTATVKQIIDQGPVTPTS